MCTLKLSRSNKYTYFTERRNERCKQACTCENEETLSKN